MGVVEGEVGEGEEEEEGLTSTWGMGGRIWYSMGGWLGIFRSVGGALGVGGALEGIKKEEELF